MNRSVEPISEASSFFVHGRWKGQSLKWNSEASCEISRSLSFLWCERGRGESLGRVADWDGFLGLRKE